ncbi:Lysophosphatidic acid phosphatase type 6 [Liparis tanakae]|uniref:Lysophosphatidic acid phosphatase type 6 n=1 Tax=Liparis tanakae TaxID=230148 RepID=A0A4Z2H0N0_9TELE|nr:Lysophosphatidic acid phosphatase type 6 [Liparis tanakae]
MRNLWTKAGVFGSMSAAFGLMLWSQKQADLDQAASGDAAAPTNPTSPYKLKLVQVLFRHGARTPLKTIPGVMEAQWLPTLLEPPAHTHIDYEVTDLLGGPRPPAPVEDSYRKNVLKGGSFPGQLTTLGMQQLYELGKTLRRRYVEESPFLSSSFSPTEVYVRSTNIVRTIESAKCLVAGLFLQKQTETVTIQTTASESEILYPNYHACKMLKAMVSHRWAESSTLPDIAADLRSIKDALGIAADQHMDFILIRDDMVARETHGLRCPSALETWRARVEQRAVDMIYHVYAHNNNPETLQLCVGPLLHSVIGNMDEKLDGTASEPDRKLFLYSAHDTTLIPCLMALGIYDMKWPPYAADITLELHQHQETNKPFVKVSYVGQDQLLPGCSGVYCPLEEFKQVLSAHLMSYDVYHALCNSDEGATDP